MKDTNTSCRPSSVPDSTSASRKPWPPEEYSRVPFWVYTDRDVFAREMARIFCGRSWSYVGLAVEIPEPGNYLTTMIGDRPVIVCRNRDDELRAFANHCAHRGVKFCRQRLGTTARFTCPYHQWTYDLNGDLKGVPFRAGVKGQGGMPADFDLAEHGLRQLRVVEHHGVLFASFEQGVEDFLEYLGDTNRYYFERVFDGRELRILGYTRQLIPGNWKLMFENIKDPYHASLLHVFLVTFGLFRADQESQVKMDESGRHGLLISRRGTQQTSEHTKDIANLRSDFKLRDPRLLDPVKEFKDAATVVMHTIWPNLIVQQQSNTLAMRQIQPRGPDAFELSWTFFGYADDDEAMQVRRLRQANLMSASGLVSGDDSEIIKLAQDGLRPYPDNDAILEMGGRETHDEDHMVTETAIRAFYKYYREVMELYDVPADLVLYRELEDLYARYAEALDDGPLENWPECFAEICLYLIIPRENVERGLPLAIMRCESRDMLKDRVTAVQDTMMYEPRYLRHHVTNLRVRSHIGQEVEAMANFSVVEVLPEELPRILMCGRYRDRLRRESDGQWRFTERLCIYDSTLVPNSIIYPV